MVDKNSIQFLSALAKNNNREWFLANKKEYEVAKEDVLQFTDKLLKGIATFDVAVKNLEAKKCLMRIYRDVRFSKDKSPYKLNYGIGISPMGKNAAGPAYYIHIQPDGNSFFGGGLWMPPADNLKLVRQEIDYNFDEFLEIIQHSDFKNTFGNLSVEDKLKTNPKGYTLDNPAIEYLKLKSFIASFAIKDEEWHIPNIENKIINAARSLYPLNQFLIRAIS